MHNKIKLFLVSVFISFQFHLSSIDLLSESLPVLLEKVNKKHEIDRQAARLVMEVGGGSYYKEIQAIVPLQPELVHKEWQKRRLLIARKIGKVFPLASSKESALWQNKARSIKELVEDAQLVAPYFRKMCIKIAKKTNSRATFGPGDAFIVKSEKSLSRKVFQDMQTIGISEKQAIARINDAVRGTIVTTSPDCIPQIIEEMKSYITKIGGKIVFRNYWEEERSSGYVGIHAKILLPILVETCPSETDDGFILTEIQIHLDCIMDGSKECVKEREHLLYEKGRTGKFDLALMAYASKLLYLTALKKWTDKSPSNR